MTVMYDSSRGGGKIDLSEVAVDEGSRRSPINSNFP